MLRASFVLLFEFARQNKIGMMNLAKIVTTPSILMNFASEKGMVGSEKTLSGAQYGMEVSEKTLGGAQYGMVVSEMSLGEASEDQREAGRRSGKMWYGR